jgi:hypothetical protein
MDTKATSTHPRKLAPFSLALTLCALWCLAANAADKPPLRKAVILVAPFENLSRTKDMIDYEVATGTDPDKPKRTFRVDRYAEAPRGILEDIFVSFAGVQIVERQRLDQLLLEGEFGRFSGLVDPEKAVKLGKMLGATAVVMGTIQNVSSATRTFSGYGITTRNTVVTAAVRVRIIDVATSRVVFSEILKGNTVQSASQAGANAESDAPFSAMEDALQRLREDEGVQEAILGRRPEGKSVASRAAEDVQEVEVDFSPKPDNTDVEIDGKYIGGSPLKWKLRTGADVKVKFLKTGFKPKEMTISPRAGMAITTQLAAEGKQ